MLEAIFKSLFKEEHKELESLRASVATLKADNDKTKAEGTPEALTAQFKTELEDRFTKLAAEHKAEIESVKASYEKTISDKEAEHKAALDAEKASVIAKTNQNLASIGVKAATVPEEIGNEIKTKFPGISFKQSKG